MADVTRRSGTTDRNEGFIVTTRAQGTTYEYVVEVTGEDECEVVERYRHEDGGRTELDAESTDSVADALDERGYEVTN